MTGNALTIEEFIDRIQNELTMSGAMPCYLKNDEIRRLIEVRALPYFWRWYRYGSIKTYYMAPKSFFETEEFTQYSYVTLPDEIQSISWVYGISDRSLFQVGINAPNLAVNLGASSQPYVSSFISTVGQLSLYKVVLESFSDVLNQMNKTTFKFDFNPNNKRLHILTKLNTSIILETYTGIEAEAMFTDNLFYEYVVALARIQLGLQLTMFDMPLAGGVKINGDAIKQMGTDDKKAIEDKIAALNSPTFFFTVKR